FHWPSDPYTETRARETLSSANSYTNNKFSALSDSVNSRFKHLSKRMTRMENKLNAGVAGVTAIASIPYVAENNFSYGVGLGNYQNGNALAAGMQYKTSPNTDVRLNVSWDSSSNSALGVGLAGGW
ncbi:YadA-like family protein, partial [Pseudocitrobacter faecalis]|uniref:YadA-like family protein n=1 Tax=Pseudocitrobacter faecalis TaxID=1398493 RepID=UPI0039F130A8